MTERSVHDLGLELEGGTLGGYRQLQLHLADLVRASMNLASEHHDEEGERDGRGILATIAADEFQLAVLGLFSRGKSTLMNAVLGDRYLPTGALPMTSVITTVRYGSRVRAAVHSGRSSFPVEVPLANLGAYVTESSQGREARSVSSAEVEVPAEVLRLGVSFVDTPGVGSAITANTATTERYLPQVDAAIFVTSVESPLTAEEIRFLAQVRRHTRRLFFVINKCDLVSRAELESILKFVRERLREVMEQGDPMVFALSAREALDARQTHDQARLEASGVLPLESTLLDYLRRDKAKEFLGRTAERADEVLRRQRMRLMISAAARNSGVADGGRLGEVTDPLERRCSDESAVISDLVGRVRTEMLTFTVDHQMEWRRDLEAALGPPLDRVLADAERSSPDQLGAILDGELSARAATWARQCVREQRQLLLRVASEDIGHLRRLVGSIPSLVVDVLGFELPAPEAREGWSRDELPAFFIPAVAWAMSYRPPHLALVTLPTWLRRSGSDWLRAQLAEAVYSYCDRLGESLRAGAEKWVDALGDQIVRETRRSAEDVRHWLTAPTSDLDLARADRIRGDLAEFRQTIESWSGLAPRMEPTFDAVQAPEVVRQEADTDCAVCRMMERDLFAYFSQEQYRLARAEEHQAEHAAGGGFCPLHTWQYADLADPTGISAAYAPLAGGIATALARLADGPEQGGDLVRAVRDLVPDPGRCPACRALGRSERGAVRKIVEAASPKPGVLCLAHLALVLENSPPEDRLPLIRSQAEGTLRASEDLRTYTLKRVSLRRDLITDEEIVGHLQVLHRLAGSPKLVAPRLRPEE
jgi:GTPase SAR1 family protein